MPKEILIADANVTAQEEFEKILEGMDAQLIFAENGEDALLKIKLYKPDLVIADVTMPNKDGSELCKIVKDNPELKHIPFVLLAGIFEDIDEAEQEKVGADGVIAKPLKGEQIVPLMENLLKGAPVKLDMEEATPASSPEVWDEKAMPSAEGSPKIEGLDEAVMSPGVEAADVDQPVGEGDEGILELTDVVDEDPSGSVPPGDHGVDQSLEQIMEGQEDVSFPEEGLSDMSLEGIDLDEPKTEFELEDVELEEESLQEGDDSSTQDTEIGRIEGLELGDLEEERERPEETDEAADRDREAELEQEIDKRIDLVLEENGEREEDDTLLELESLGEETSPPSEETETLGPFEEEIAPDETPESVGRSDLSALREDDFVEPERAEDGEAGVNVDELLEELPAADIGELEEKEPEQRMPAKGSEETLEELEASAEILQEGVAEAEDLGLEELEGAEKSAEELEDIPMDEELEKLLDEAVPEFDEPGEVAEEEGLGEGLKAERTDEAPVEEELSMEGLDEELPPGTGPEEEVVEKALGDIEPESQGEGPDFQTLEDMGEPPLEELEEELDEAEDLLEEPFDEDAEGSGEAVSYPKELIKEGEVSEEELNAFQKRLSAEFETSLSQTEQTAEPPPDVHVEELVREAVEHILQNVSETVVPELTKAIVQVASSRIERLVQRVVPDLAESAIKREIERLQKEK